MSSSDLAKRLWLARVDGRQLALSQSEQCLSVEDAYRLQQDYIGAADSPLNGWKVGATNPQGQAALGLSEPFAGPLFERFTHRSPMTFPITGDQPVIVEVEFVLRLGEDIAHGETRGSLESVRNAVDAVCPALEIGGARLGSLTESSTPLLIADAAGNGGVVYGPPINASRLEGLEGQQGALIINGQVIETGTGADVLGHPLNALLWLLEHLSRYGRGLRRGDLITTGTCTGINEAKIGDEVVGDFGELGRVEVTLSGAQ